MKIISILAAGVISLTPTAIYAQEQLPDIAKAMLQSAIETNDPVKINAVQDALKDVFPDYASHISEVANGKITEIETAQAAQEAIKVAELEAEEKAKTAGGLFAISPWAGKINVGAAQASGNSDNLAVGFLLDANRQVGRYTHNIDAFIDIADSNGVRTQQRWGAAYKLDYLINDRAYAFGRFSYDEDAFSGFDYRLFGGAGAGYFLSKNDVLTWKVEAGPGYQYSLIDDTDENQNSFALYGASETDWKIREGLIFEQDFRVTWTSPTTTFQSITSLNAALTSAISAGVSYEVRYETSPPPGNVNTDRILRANVSYGF